MGRSWIRLNVIVSGYTHSEVRSCCSMATSRCLSSVRKFSTSSLRAKLVQPPIQLFGTEGRYAHALYSAASKEKKLDVVEKELKGFVALANKEAALKEFMSDPSIKRVEKTQALEALLTKQKATKVTTNFLASLAENGRLPEMASIIGAFDTIMAAHRGEVICKVTTAKELDPKNMKDLQATLKLFLKEGETIKLTTAVDPSLIGGMVVVIGDKYVDMSMQAKIKAYTDLIQQPI